MIESIEQFFLNLFGGNAILTIIFIAILPIIELRGSILFGLGLLGIVEGLTKWQILLASFLGSMAVVPILLLLLLPIIKWLKSTKLFNKMATRIEERFQKKSDKLKSSSAIKATNSKKTTFLKMLGICLFVALPLPGTGVWTGSAVAVFLGLDFKKSLISIAIGDAIAAIIVLTVGVLLEAYINIVLIVFLCCVVVVLLLFVYEIFIKKSES